MECPKCHALIEAIQRARFYWYGLALDPRQAVLFQRGIDVLVEAAQQAVASDMPVEERT